MTMAPTIQIFVGKTTFQAAYADGMPTYRVERARGRGTYDCVIVSPDYKGETKVFGAEEIRRAIAWEKALDNTMSKIDAWYDKIPLGAIVHYDNGFGQYVRCRVVMGTTVHSAGKSVKCLLPIALVGNWYKNDLPHRRLTGELVKGYHAERIEKGEMFRPSTVYEVNPHGPDPKNMPALDLTVPEATPEQVERMRLNKAIEEIRNAAETGEYPRDTLDKLFAMTCAALQVVTPFK